jgi:hypothetical protein
MRGRGSKGPDPCGAGGPLLPERNTGRRRILAVSASPSIPTNDKQPLGALVAQHSMQRNSRQGNRFAMPILHSRDHAVLRRRADQRYRRRVFPGALVDGSRLGAERYRAQGGGGASVDLIPRETRAKNARQVPSASDSTRPDCKRRPRCRIAAASFVLGLIAQHLLDRTSDDANRERQCKRRGPRSARGPLNGRRPPAPRTSLRSCPPCAGRPVRRDGSGRQGTRYMVARDRLPAQDGRQADDPARPPLGAVRPRERQGAARPRAGASRAGERRVIGHVPRPGTDSLPPWAELLPRRHSRPHAPADPPAS